jgi:peptidoglycan/LPS O-acetylase OafA/YrhL
LGGLFLDFNGPFWRILGLPGKLSYGGYLWQASVLFFLWPLLGGWNEYAAFAAFAAATTLAAWFSYRFFEEPCNLFIRRRFAHFHSPKV